MKLSLKEARKRFSEMVKRASIGEEIEVTVHGKVEARIVPPKKEREMKKKLPDLTEFRKTIKIRGESLTDTLIKLRRSKPY
jgi:prevent-host-death family protein